MAFISQTEDYRIGIHSEEELNLLTSQKLAAVAVKLITVESPNGPDPALPIDALLEELDQSAECDSTVRTVDRYTPHTVLSL